MLVTKAGPSTIGQSPVAVTMGAVVGAATAPRVWWELADRVNQFDYGPRVFNAASAFSAVPPGEEWFLAVDLNFDGASHYGWISYQLQAIGAFGIVRGWAYETEPNTPIFAGIIPEPSVLGLGLAASICGCWQRRRRGAMASV